MAVENNVCELSRDCTEGDVLKYCYEKTKSSNDTFFCDCAAWYGWTGEDCNERSSALNVITFTSFVLVFWDILILITSLRSIGLNYFMSQQLNILFATNLFVLLASLSYFVSLIIRLKGNIDPKYFIIYSADGILVEQEEIVVVANVDLGNYSLLLFTFFQTMSSLTLMISWASVIKKVSKFSHPQEIRSATNYGTKMIILGAFYFLLVMVLTLANSLIEAYLLVAFFSITVSILYIIIALRFESSVTNLFYTTDNIAVIETVAFVKKVCKLNAISLTTASVLSIPAFILVIDHEEILLPGDFNYALLIRDIGTMGLLSSLTITLWYVNSVTLGVLLADEYPILCKLWYYWDKMNRKLISDEYTEAGTSHIDK